MKVKGKGPPMTTATVKEDPKKKFRARPGFHIDDGDAQIIGEFCDSLIAKHGTVSPSLFVREARHNQKIRHFLEWDNDKAAEQWRLQQARRYIVSFTVTLQREDREVEVRAFHYIDTERGHQPIGRIVEDSDQMQVLLERAKKDAVQWYHRYQTLRSVADLGPVFEAIETALAALVATGPPKRGRPEKQAAA